MKSKASQTNRARADGLWQKGTEVKKNHTYEVCFYTSGGFLIRRWIDARTKAECIKKAREENKVIEMYSIRFIR